MTAKQFKMKKALHTDTPSGLNAAYNRGRELARSGGNELALNEGVTRCKSEASADVFRNGYFDELKIIYSRK